MLKDQLSYLRSLLSSIPVVNNNSPSTPTTTNSNTPNHKPNNFTPNNLVPNHVTNLMSLNTPLSTPQRQQTMTMNASNRPHQTNSTPIHNLLHNNTPFNLGPNNTQTIPPIRSIHPMLHNNTPYNNLAHNLADNVRNLFWTFPHPPTCLCPGYIQSYCIANLSCPTSTGAIPRGAILPSSLADAVFNMLHSHWHTTVVKCSRCSIDVGLWLCGLISAAESKSESAHKI